MFAAHSALSLLLPNFAYSSTSGQWGFYRRTDDTEQLYIDGMTVGRGWNQLYVYGNALWDNKFELRMPIIKEAFWLVGFFDAAALLDEPWSSLSNGVGTSLDKLVPDDFLFSFGFGVRFTIPQFPLRFYLALGLPGSQRAGCLAEWQPQSRRGHPQLCHLPRWRHLLRGGKR